MGKRAALVGYILFVGVVALTGGSSRFDVATQPVVRLAAILLIAALSLRMPERSADAYRPALWFLAALAGLIAIQLIPLPPGLWAALPGHGQYLAAAVAAGEPQPWRPINLVPDRGWNALFALLPAAATIMAARRLRMRDQGPILLTLLVIVIASAVIGLAQVSAGMDDTLRFYAAPPTGSAVGLFANRNHQALLLACGLPMLALWADRTRTDRVRGRFKALLAALCAAFLLLMIPTTGSRAGLLLAVVALPIASVMAWPTMKTALETLSPRRRRAVAWGGMLLSAVLILAALTFSRDEAIHRLFATDPAEEARVKLLRPLLAMIGDFFPTGSGFGSFDPVYRGYESFQNLSVTFMNQAHDDYLQVMMEGGLPALILLLLFVGWWAWTSFGLWRPRSGESGGLGRLGSAILLLIMLASVADYPVRTPLMMVIAAQSAAWMMAARRRKMHALSVLS